VLRNALAAVVVLASLSWGQTGVTARLVAPAGYTDEVAQVRFHYGVAVRNGTEDDGGPGLTYSGVTPNDLAGSLWLWFLFGNHLGLTASFGREGFSLVSDTGPITGGGLIRFSAGPTGRVRFGPVRLEAAASYAFHQVPVFGTITTPVFSAAPRHGILLAARGLLELGPITVEGRFEATPSLALPTVTATSFGLGAGGGVRVQLLRTGSLKWGLVAEVLWHRDTLAGSTLTTRQDVIRAGAALDVQWKDPSLEKDVTTGTVEVRVRSETGPLANAVVTVDSGAMHRTVTTDAEGLGSLADVSAGEVVAVGTLVGYERVETRASLNAADTVTLELTMKKEKPKFGGLAIRVVNFDGKVPVAGASIDVNGKSVSTDATGALMVEGLNPGPVSIKVTAPGFTTGEDAASVVAGVNSEVVITLVPEKKQVPATLSGQVRNARGDKPVAARLELKELKQTVSCDESGQFSLQIPGGKYTIRISATGFVTQTKTVTVRDGDQAIFNLDLAPK
jgi:hypothetical protein